MSFEFLITALVVVLIPGTGVIYTISNGLFLGRKYSFAAALGCTFGITPHLLASIFGLAALLHASAVAFEFIRYVGIAYLLYLAYGMWKESGKITLAQPDQRVSLRQIAVRGTLINILNPKLSIFFLAFLPQFVPATVANPLQEMTTLSLVFMAMTFVVFLIYGALAATLRDFVIGNEKVTRWMQRVFAGTFVGLSAKLALDD